MFSKKIVPDFTPRRPFVKTKETATAPVQEINLPPRILISESQKVLPKAAAPLPPSINRQEYISLASPPVAPRFIQGPSLTTIPILDPTPITGGNVSYSPSLETFPSIGESYFKLASDTGGNVSEWSLYPALQTVIMNNNSIEQVQSIGAYNIGIGYNLNYQNSLIAGGNVSFESTLTTQDITVTSGAVRLTPSHILETIGGDLFFDTELLAKAGDIQNVADWSLYPALSTVNYNNEAIVGVSTINTQPLSYYTVSNWSQYPSISTIDVASNNIINVSTINSLPYPPPVGDASLWSHYAAVSTVNIAQNDIINVSTINSLPYPPPGGDASLWSHYAAVSTVNMNGNQIANATNNIDLGNGSWTSPANNVFLSPQNQVEIGTTALANSALLVNNIAANGKPNGTVGQYLSHDADTIVWVDAVDASNWASFPASQNVALGGYSLGNATSLNILSSGNAVTLSAGAGNVLTINGTPLSGSVTSVNGAAGAISITSDPATVTTNTVGTTTTFSAPTLGVSTDVATTCFGVANGAALSATSAGLAAAGATADAAAASALATSAGAAALAAQATASLALSQSGITSVNGGFFSTTIAAGVGIGVATTFSSGTTNPTVTISATGTAGVTTLNTLTGALTLAAGTGISVTPSGGNTLTLANTIPGSSFVASYDIYVTPNGNDTTGTGSANNPYLTIAKAITVRATLSLLNEVSIRLASGTYAESAILIANTYLVGVVTGEADQPVNITGNITMSGATGQSGIVGLQLNAPATGANVTISGAGTFAINNCNITAGVSASPACYILNHSSTGTCYMTECRMTCSPTSGVEGIFGSATLIMRDCFMGTAGPAGMILYQGNLTVRQCNLVSTSASSGVNGIILYQPPVANRTCEVSYSVLQYTSAAAAALKGCIVVSNGAATALVNIVNNLLICEGTTNGTGPNNYHCIWKTAGSVGNACTMSYGNLLGGVTAHAIDANITKTAFSAVP